MRILSSMPTDRAMKELSKTSVLLPSTRVVVETISVYKMDLVRCLRMMQFRESFLKEMVSFKMTEVDKTMAAYCHNNPDFDY